MKNSTTHNREKEKYKNYRENAPVEKQMADFFERRIICEEKKCNIYEILMKKCLNIHKLVFYRNQHFKEKETLKCRTLITTIIQE